MSFSERPASKQWAALKYRGEKFADVWFKPEGEPFGVTFRIPQENFQIPGLGKDLTIENLLKAVAIAPEEVESWLYGGMDGPNPDVRTALPPPPPDIAHLDIHIRLKPPSAPSPLGGEGRGEGTPPEKGEGDALAAASSESKAEGERETDVVVAWPDLEARWKAIVGIEATMDTLRISMQSLLVQMEGSLKQTLTVEEKTYALRADVAQWERAKNRVHFSLPKVKDIIHRAVWALGSPDRKRLGQLYEDHIEPHIPFPGMNDALRQLEELQKDRQVLYAHANTVYQECKSVATDVHSAVRTLQSNAAANAKNKKNEGKGGSFFKSVRKWSGA